MWTPRRNTVQEKNESRTIKCNSWKLGPCLACRRSSKETRVAGLQEARKKKIKDDIREGGKCLIT